MSNEPILTKPEFIAVLRASRLLDEATLGNLPDADDAESLARQLRLAGHLTHYQAAAALRGYWSGLVLGPYRLLAPLGRGGMGTVYLARCDDPARAPRLVALKVVPPKRAEADPRLLARFEREIAFSKRADHPNLTRGYDAGSFDGVNYLAMEYVPGMTLGRRIVKRSKLSVPDAARIIIEVAAGLAFAHKLGILHRDVKPSNIMVPPNGPAKLLDLGFALDPSAELPVDRGIVGGRGHVVGTMDYVAPEQTTDAVAIDGRADLYALGATLYHAVSGRPPFYGGTSREKIARHRTEQPAPLTDVPPAFAKLVMKMLAKRPEDRFASAEEVGRALSGWAAAAQPSMRKSDSEIVAAVEAGEEPLDTVEMLEAPMHPLAVVGLIITAVLGFLGVLMTLR